jgi:hypothetical protein
MHHICLPGYADVPDVRVFYDRAGLIPTSTNADIALIRSHIAYWFGTSEADRAVIAPSRGHSYRVRRVRGLIGDAIVRITDHYDHREGVTGLR